jgi:5-(hydroxymethyl)furfural/furfural oxidase
VGGGGRRGWGWFDVLPHFRRAERDLDLPDDPLHGRDGPFPIRRVRREDFSPFIRTLEATLNAGGHPPRDDQNGAWQDGTYPCATNLDEDGRRASVATAYLSPAVRSRPNLAILTGTTVERLRSTARASPAPCSAARTGRRSGWPRPSRSSAPAPSTPPRS